ncbi:MAG: spore coat protein U domain-containing protein [Betaproteobacteria bacterium]
MKFCLRLMLVLFPSLLLCGQTWAAYNCTVIATNVSVVYSPTVAIDNVSTGSWTINCTRLAGDAANLAYSIQANNGLQNGGGSNRVRRGATANFYSYDIYRLTPYTGANRWQGAQRFTGTLAFGASLSANVSGPFDLMVPGPQTVTTAGTYTDTITMTLRNTATNTTLDTGTFNVSVVTSNSCQITTAPGNMNFSYVSFQNTAATAGTSFETRCTTSLPYTIALDVTSGTLLGLNYTLTLPVTSGTGNGTDQTFNINGSIAANQAGNCTAATCSGSQTRTLTISY